VSQPAAESTVAVDVVFERFPASIRGAVVVRGRDPEPHQIRLEELAVVEAHGSGRPAHEVPTGGVTVDVVPRGEILVPFDVPFSDLQPGWYAVSARVIVDGQQKVSGPDEPTRFLVPWPSEDVRKGVVDAGLTIRVPGSDGAVVERVECKADRAVVRWHHGPGPDPDMPEFAELRVLAGSRRLPALDSTYDADTGARTTVVHPVLKRYRQLTFELDKRFTPGRPPQRGKWAARLDLP
jgi:hypothetical protein